MGTVIAIENGAIYRVKNTDKTLKELEPYFYQLNMLNTAVVYVDNVNQQTFYYYENSDKQEFSALSDNAILSVINVELFEQIENIVLDIFDAKLNKLMNDCLNYQHPNKLNKLIEYLDNKYAVIGLDGSLAKLRTRIGSLVAVNKLIHVVEQTNETYGEEKFQAMQESYIKSKKYIFQQV